MGISLSSQMVQERIQTEKTQVVKVSSTVTYKDTFGKIHTYQIVQNHEMDITKNKISVSSPLAQAVLGKLSGETAVVKAPTSEYAIEIVGLD